MSLLLACSSLGLGYLLVLELLLLTSLVVVHGSSPTNSASSASTESSSWHVTSTASATSRSCWVRGILSLVVPSDLLETG
jgi:hypothetical protein